jgi:hypothetical protein
MVADMLSKGVSKKVFYNLLYALIGRRRNRPTIVGQRRKRSSAFGYEVDGALAA